jgi:hypothetical protein
MRRVMLDGGRIMDIGGGLVIALTWMVVALILATRLYRMETE